MAPEQLPVYQLRTVRSRPLAAFAVASEFVGALQNPYSTRRLPPVSTTNSLSRQVLEARAAVAAWSDVHSALERERRSVPTDQELPPMHITHSKVADFTIVVVRHPTTRGIFVFTDRADEIGVRATIGWRRRLRMEVDDGGCVKESVAEKTRTLFISSVIAFCRGAGW